jgi:hypothetical protein
LFWSFINQVQSKRDENVALASARTIPFVLSAAHSAVYRRMGEARWFVDRATPQDCHPPSIRLRLLMKLLAIRLSPQAGKSLVIGTNGTVV